MILPTSLSRSTVSRALSAFGLLALVLAAWAWRDVPGDAWTYRQGGRPLAGITSWHYQLDKVDVASLSQRDVDMLVTDYAREGGKIPLTADEVTKLKTKPNGQRRVVISYLSIGEAEEFRFYWNEAWKAQKPAWLERENCAWPKAWMVRFWEPGWRDLIVAGPDAYLKRIIAAGFDGVYLDRVDMWEHTTSLNPNAKTAMIDFVANLAATARALKPGFIIIGQNAEDLLEDRRYRRTVDAVAKEELFFSRTGTGERNKAADTASSLAHLNQLRWQWKPVFPVEYLQKADDIKALNIEARGKGLVPVFPTRALDGGDPTAPVALEKEAGTPEFIKDKCPPGTSW
jgi:cysteinyl-tRNA synthetase, unknown class